MREQLKTAFLSKPAFSETAASVFPDLLIPRLLQYCRILNSGLCLPLLSYTADRSQCVCSQYLQKYAKTLQADTYAV